MKVPLKVLLDIREKADYIHSQLDSAMASIDLRGYPSSSDILQRQRLLDLTSAANSIRQSITAFIDGVEIEIYE